MRALIEQVYSPLAIRSSSLLEDATYEPFAGVYATKMIPNDQYDSRARFHNLALAIKFIYASTYYKSAKSYREATRHSHAEEKMAVIIQEVVGKRYQNRFYPEFSGVVRSYNSLCQTEMATPVEIEFAMTFNPHRLGFLQARPMVVSSESVEVLDEDLVGQDALAASENILGNGVVDNITDIVYVIPEHFKKEYTRLMADELEIFNRSLLEEERPYLLIVFGRLGSSDPWLLFPISYLYDGYQGDIVAASIMLYNQVRLEKSTSLGIVVIGNICGV
ncbi:MAG: PEP/pyruvate-binding domain-containing protein [Anaerolineales bacterium]|nr:PEP/pyruvate-binding domain-containing protein [Anaerolineales bacterium]